MSDFIHKYENRTAFATDYYGNAYTEPWTSTSGEMVTEFTASAWRDTLQDEKEELSSKFKLTEIRHDENGELYVWTPWYNGDWDDYNKITTRTCNFSANDEIEANRLYQINLQDQPS